MFFYKFLITVIQIKFTWHFPSFPTHRLLPAHVRGMVYAPTGCTTCALDLDCWACLQVCFDGLVVTQCYCVLFKAHVRGMVNAPTGFTTCALGRELKAFDGLIMSQYYCDLFKAHVRGMMQCDI